MRKLRAVFVLSAACVLMVPAVAVASPEPGLSEYHAAPGCPGEFTFRAQVQARTERFELTPAGDTNASTSTVRFVVRLRQEADGYAGTLEVVRDGASTRSELEAKTCDEVVAGLSIAAALSGSSDADTPSARSKLPTTQSSAPPAADASAISSAPPPTHAHEELPETWLLGAELGGRLGYSQRPAVSVGALLGHSPAVDASGIGFRAALGVTFANDVASGGSPPLRLDFTWLGAAGDLCPLRVSAGAMAALLPCVSLEVGALRASATNGESSLRPWVAPGLVLRFSAMFGGFFVEPALAARVPLFRDRYWFRPDTQAFLVPILAVEAALGAGIVF